MTQVAHQALTFGDLLSGVQDVICAALSIEDKTLVRPESRLVEDLGAQPIDLADICFKLENLFNIKIDGGVKMVESSGTVQELVGHLWLHVCRL
jgi:acyl carrier protein